MVNALDDYKFVPNKPAGECIITQKNHNHGWIDYSKNICINIGLESK